MKTRKFSTILAAAFSTSLLFGCFDRTENKAAEHLPGEPPPKVLPNSITVKPGKRTYVVSGLGVGKTNRMAVVNHEVYPIGAEIEPGIILKDVELTYARIVVHDVEHLLRPESIQKQMDMKRRASGK